jgi:hypothetical protein
VRALSRTPVQRLALEANPSVAVGSIISCSLLRGTAVFILPLSRCSVPPFSLAMSSSSAADVRVATAATVDVVLELSQALRCGLDRKAVQILMALIDAGLQPAALARAVRALRRQAAQPLQPGAAAADAGLPR